MSTNEKDALKRIRIANLSRLAELNGSRSRLAEILGKAPQQINDMIRARSLLEHESLERLKISLTFLQEHLTRKTQNSATPK